MNILVLPGDGIGPEISAATVAVLEACDRALGLGLTFEHRDIGLANGAERAPGYRLLTAAIKAGCGVAIRLSERI